jgi:negative regulator of sigma-B (phosphoserine phosphatase)
MPVFFGIAQRVCEGETVCGDGYLTRVLENGALVSVVDGLGHGPQAGEAATAFNESVKEHVALGVQAMMEEANRALNGTRGAAAAILRVDEAAKRVSFTGVGNIEMHAFSDVKMRPVCAPGIVGHRVRKMLAFEFELPKDATIALCSDGISSRLHFDEYTHLEPQEIADLILEEHGKLHDDATCVVMRYSNEG